MRQHSLPILVVLSMSAASCSDDGGGNNPACTPGLTQVCTCVGGGSGVQTCNSAGTGWETCQCGTIDTWTDPDVPVDTAPDTTTDTAHDTTPDTTVDTTPDTTPDTSGCTTSAECAADRVCMYGECSIPWGSEFTFVLVDGIFPEHQWSDGSEYDAFGGMPDPQANLTIDGLTCSTPTIDDTLSPFWNVACNFTVYASSTYEVAIYDEDVTDWQLIASWASYPLSIDILRAGGVYFPVWTYDTGVEYDLLNITVYPR